PTDTATVGALTGARADPGASGGRATLGPRSLLGRECSFSELSELGVADLVLNLAARGLVVGQREEDHGGVALPGDQVAQPTGLVLHEHGLVTQPGDRLAVRVDICGDRGDCDLIRPCSAVAVDAEVGMAAGVLEIGAASCTWGRAFGQGLNVVAGDGLDV